VSVNMCCIFQHLAVFIYRRVWW